MRTERPDDKIRQCRHLGPAFLDPVGSAGSIKSSRHLHRHSCLGFEGMGGRGCFRVVSVKSCVARPHHGKCQGREDTRGEWVGVSARKCYLAVASSFTNAAMHDFP